MFFDQLALAPMAASMGPLFFRAENVHHGGQSPAVVGASMGPLFFRAENGNHTRYQAGSLDASMGPLFFRAENQQLDAPEMQA